MCPKYLLYIYFFRAFLFYIYLTRLDWPKNGEADFFESLLFVNGFEVLMFSVKCLLIHIFFGRRLVLTVTHTAGF